MEFTRGNRAIRDHAEDGKDLHLFESLGKGHRYLGMFACSTWEYRQGTDLEGDERRVIVFHLIQLKEEEEQEAPPPPLPEFTLDQLRQRALEATSQAKKSTPQEAKGYYYKRSIAAPKRPLTTARNSTKSTKKKTVMPSRSL